MRIALAQINPLVGDLPGNAARIAQVCRDAEIQGADLVVTPELSLWGYPPRDLLLSRSRVEAQETVLSQLSQQLAGLRPDLGVLVGVVDAAEDGPVSYTHLTLPTICSV